MRNFLSFIFLICFGSLAISQDFNYVKYNTLDGLPGSTVYDMCQDVDGFIWFATDNGLSRFDGTHFKNYSVKDGLPDNEILSIYADSKGRVWIGSFSRETCYEFKGKIYNSHNTPVLSQIKLVTPLASVMEDGSGNLLFCDQNILLKLSPDNRVENLTQNPIFKKHSFKHLELTHFIDNGKLLIGFDDSLFSYRNDTLAFYVQGKNMIIRNWFATGFSKSSPLIELANPNSLIKQTAEGLRITYISTSSGAWAIDTLQNKLGDHFLDGQMVSYTMRDSENNLWFATMGAGVYKLPSRETRTIHVNRKNETPNTEVFSLMKHNGLIYCGMNSSEAVLFDHFTEKARIDLSSQTIESAHNPETNRLYCSLDFSPEVVFFGFDAFLARVSPAGVKCSYYGAIKSVEKLDDSHLLVSNFLGAFIVQADDLAIVDTIWNSRVTKAIPYEGKFIIGTTNGLYEVQRDRHAIFLGNLHPALTRRIASITVLDSTIWVANSNDGLVGLKDGKVVAVFNELNGLSSNFCKTILAADHCLWVGTNKGLNKIDFRTGNHRIIKYGVVDGLPSDIINAVYVSGNQVYVGSPAGLTHFDEDKIASNSICNIQLLETTVDPSAKRNGEQYILDFRHSNIDFKYVAISFRSAGEILYYYRLNGLDETWKTTSLTSLEYASLPPGKYDFELYAVNKFGVKSNVVAVHFVVSTPFWRSWWFYVGAALLIIFGTTVALNIRNKNAKRRLEEQHQVQHRFAELEQQALQAQMNPHFIFNCLNSIQHYFLTNDSQRANRFLSLFATLVRETLYFSGRQRIKVSEEVNYLRRYLEMEKMRFGDNFSYKIEVDESVEADFVEMPALLLQPYVENAIRHGIRYKQDETGILSISFRVEKEVLHIKIRDNGIGRQKSKELKGRQHIEYQSRGMELGQKRIDILNSLQQNKISIEIHDLSDEAGNAAGTEVYLKIPV